MSLPFGIISISEKSFPRTIQPIEGRKWYFA
jgi:hypothetical protein